MWRRLVTAAGAIAPRPQHVAMQVRNFTRALNPKANANSFTATSLMQPKAPLTRVVPIRRLNIHEYQALALLDKYHIRRAPGSVASSVEEAMQIVRTLQQFSPGKDFVVKAQVLAGGRGKGVFENGFRGGVHVCTSPEEVEEVCTKMLGHKLVTKQTGAEGKPCSKVLISERLFLRREAYFAITMDRASQGPVMIASSEGGMDIETVASYSPELISREVIDMTVGVQDEQLERLAVAVGFDNSRTKPQAVIMFRNLYDLFMKSDCTLLEINPLAETHDGFVLCIDAKVNIDDNADFRQKEIFGGKDDSQMDSREVTAAHAGLNYIGLDGTIGCLVNGAGLAMATMDVIKLYGGSPANFLDIGGGASEKQVVEALKLLNADPHVKCVLVNIFGGIMRCDVIALGLIRAAAETGMKKPLVVRLAGTNVEEAKKLIEDSGLRMVTSDDLGDAAQKAVRITDIMKMAEQAKLKVSFELPL